MENENILEAQKKDRVLKSFAIGGFIGLIILIAWISIQLVSFLPTALTSLASLADSVYNYQPVVLTVVNNKNVASVGEVATISWSIPKQTGTFTFSYICNDGVAVDRYTKTGEIQNLTCENNYNLGNVSYVDILINSEKNHFTDINYEIGFIPEKASAPTATTKNSLTVVNPNISPIVVIDEETTTSTLPDIILETPPIIETPIATTTKPNPPAPIYEQHYVYEIPVSNPNGFTDLSTKFLATGIINNNTFVNTGTIEQNKVGAIQFEVKNIGTKTSNTWTFVAKLPNGTTYTSGTQTALKPNERSVITLGFSKPTSTGIKNFNISSSVSSGDSKVSNNSFSAVVVIK